MIRVMIVEDDPMVAMINSKFLEKIEGISLSGVANDLTSARNLLETSDIDLVLLDLYLPKESGMDLLKWIRQENKPVDVILITADNNAEAVQEAFRLGAVDYLIKPFSFERFKASLDKYRYRRKNIQDKDKFTQEDLDRMTIQLQDTDDNAEIEKGINKYTLVSVLKVFNDFPDQYFSADEISEKSSVAPVTVRRYLNYLEKNGQIELLVEYGKIGRPHHRYKKS